jgi:hypothetical protein
MARRTVDGLWNAVGVAIDDFSPAQCRHRGYGCAEKESTLAPAEKRLASSSPTPDCCGGDAPVPRHVFAACLFRPPARNSIGLVARNGNESLRFVVDAEPQALGMLAM